MTNTCIEVSIPLMFAMDVFAAHQPTPLLLLVASRTTRISAAAAVAAARRSRFTTRRRATALLRDALPPEPEPASALRCRASRRSRSHWRRRVSPRLHRLNSRRLRVLAPPLQPPPPPLCTTLCHWWASGRTARAPAGACATRTPTARPTPTAESALKQLSRSPRPVPRVFSAGRLQPPPSAHRWPTRLPSLAKTPTATVRVSHTTRTRVELLDPIALTLPHTIAHALSPRAAANPQSITTNAGTNERTQLLVAPTAHAAELTASDSAAPAAAVAAEQSPANNEQLAVEPLTLDITNNNEVFSANDSHECVVPLTDAAAAPTTPSGEQLQTTASDAEALTTVASSSASEAVPGLSGPAAERSERSAESSAAPDAESARPEVSSVSASAGGGDGDSERIDASGDQAVSAEGDGVAGAASGESASAPVSGDGVDGVGITDTCAEPALSTSTTGSTTEQHILPPVTPADSLASAAAARGVLFAPASDRRASANGNGRVDAADTSDGGAATGTELGSLTPPPSVLTVDPVSGGHSKEYNGASAAAPRRPDDGERGADENSDNVNAHEQSTGGHESRLSHVLAGCILVCVACATNTIQPNCVD